MLENGRTQGSRNEINQGGFPGDARHRLKLHHKYRSSELSGIRAPNCWNGKLRDAMVVYRGSAKSGGRRYRMWRRWRSGKHSHRDHWRVARSGGDYSLSWVHPQLWQPLNAAMYHTDLYPPLNANTSIGDSRKNTETSKI